MSATNLLDALPWMNAVSEAKSGYPDRLAKLLRDPAAMPTAEAREYLAAIVDGSQRPPVRDTRTKLAPQLLAKLRGVIAMMADKKAYGSMSQAKYKRQKDALIAEISAMTGAKPIVVTKRWNEMAAAEGKRAMEQVAWMRQLQSENAPPTARSTVYRMGKHVGRRIKSES